MFYIVTNKSIWVAIPYGKNSYFWAFTPKFECEHSFFSVNSQNSSVNTHIAVLTLNIECALPFFKCMHSHFLRVYTQNWVFILNFSEHTAKIWRICSTVDIIRPNLGVDAQL